MQCGCIHRERGTSLMRTVLVAKHVNGLPITEAECLEQSSTRRERGFLSALSFGGFSPWSLDSLFWAWGETENHGRDNIMKQSHTVPPATRKRGEAGKSRVPGSSEGASLMTWAPPTGSHLLTVLPSPSSNTGNSWPLGENPGPPQQAATKHQEYFSRRNSNPCEHVCHVILTLGNHSCFRLCV